MKGDTKVPISIVIAVLLVIAVSAILIEFVQGDITPDAGGYVAPKQNSVCNLDSDCSRGVCASIDGSPNACVCFKDDDCGGTPYVCMENKCQRMMS